MKPYRMYSFISASFAQCNFSFTHVVMCISSSYLFTAEQHPVVSQFVHSSPVDGHLGFLLFCLFVCLAVFKAAMNIFVPVFFVYMCYCLSSIYT